MPSSAIPELSWQTYTRTCRFICQQTLHLDAVCERPWLTTCDTHVKYPKHGWQVPAEIKYIINAIAKLGQGASDAEGRMWSVSAISYQIISARITSLTHILLPVVLVYKP
jgi:hypothetical protein